MIMPSAAETREILLEAVRNGIIDLSDTGLMEQIKMTNRRKYLEKHAYSVYQGSDGLWYTYLPGDSGKRRKIKRRTRESIEDEIIEYYRSEEENPTLEEVFEEWQDRQKELSKIRMSTITRYRTDFDRYFVRFKNTRIKSVTPEMVSDFLEEQLAMHRLTSRAFSNLKIITRGLLKRAKRRKLINFNVESVFQELDVSEHEFRKDIKPDGEEIFFDDEFDRILEYCHEHRDDERCLGVALMFVSGIRVGELVCLRHEDIGEGSVYVHRTEMYYKEGDEHRYEIEDYPKTPAGVRRVIVPDTYGWVTEGLKAANPGREFIFYSQRGKRLHTDGIRRKQYEICRKLGIPVRSPHKARKTYGTILLQSRIDEKLIQKQMGHTDISCTKNYYYRDRNDETKKRDAINSIPLFGRKIL